jgi:hypothetical protein
LSLKPERLMYTSRLMPTGKHHLKRLSVKITGNI